MEKFDFKRDVVDASHTCPILVDFWAPWCGPCRVLGPVLERMAENAHGQWALVKVNTEEQPEVAQEYRISSIPAVKLFHRGKVTAEFAGALPESAIARWLMQHIPGPGNDALEEAKEARGRGDKTAARTLFKRALEKDPDHTEARVALAELQFTDDPAGSVQLVNTIWEGAPLFDHADAIRELHRIWELDEGSVDTASKAWPSFKAGREALKAGQYEEAAERWIDALRRDRKWGEDASRKACVALFRWLGDTHPVTQGQRRAFSLALF